MAFTWTGPNQDNPDIYVQQIGAGAPLRLTTDPANDYSPVWSPDGRAIAFLRQQPDPRVSELRLIPPLGGPERRLTVIQPRQFLRPVTLAWCPDSTCVVVTDSSSPDETKPDAVLVVVSIGSGEKKPLTRPQPDAYADTDPAVSPDGRWLAFRRDRAPLSGQLQLLQLGGDLTAAGEPRTLTPTLLQASGPEWISNTEVLFSAKGSLWRMTPTDGRPAERLAFVGEDGQSPAVSRPPQGQPARLVYVRSYRDTNIWRLDVPAPGAPASSPPVVAISSTRGDLIPQLSPDGRRIAFNSTRSGENEIWLADTSGTNAVQLTYLAANPGYAHWSPDGRTIVFQTNSEERPAGEVFAVPAEGGTPRNLTSHPANDAIASFSRDGRWIYFSSTRGGSPFIWKVPAAGGEAVQVSPRNGMLGVESLDGADLYYVESQSTDTPGPLWRLPLTGGEPVRLVDGVLATHFEVVDGGIYYLERLPGATRLRYVDFATRQSTVVAANLGTVGLGLTASRDGRTIFFTRVDAAVDDLMLVENFR